MRCHRILPLLFCVLSTGACRTGAGRPESALGDPAAGLVALPGAADGWRAQLALDVAPSGVWCVRPFEVFERYAGPELVALDDQGRVWVLVSYGGRWTPFVTGPDSGWVGAVTQGDLDPRLAGDELYVGSERGRIWQVAAHEREGLIDRRLVAQLDGRQVHSLVAGEFDLRHDGAELLVFTEPAEVWKLVPRTDGRDGFEARLVVELDARVRDALVVDRDVQRSVVQGGGMRDQVYAVSRAGWFGIADQPGPHFAPEHVHELPQGRGRLARPAEGPIRNAGVLAYTTAEDGSV